MPRVSPLLLVILFAALLARPAYGQTNVVYSSSFEPGEGYDPQFELVGQDGWIGSSGASGMVSNFFNGLGQQGYIGYAAPAQNTNDFLTVYRPVNVAPIPTNQALLTFSVLMQVVDSSSTNGPWDDFRWSVYNTNGARLFSLNFDNSSLMISTILDDGRFVATNTKFDNQGLYHLEISMNFAHNLWTALLNDEVVVNAQPITTAGSALNLGDMDAVWALRDPKKPGDNYLLFDNYTITQQSGSSIPPRLEAAASTKPGTPFGLRLYGEPGLVYQVEGSEDYKTWAPVLTFTAPQGGILDFQDAQAPAHSRRFYRARQTTQ